MAKYYLAGPMSGIPQYNFPKFERIAKELRQAGYEIISPAELDSDAIRTEALASDDGKIDGQLPVDNKTLKIGGETWGQILGRDVRVIADEADGVVVMDGWENSKGARLEVFVANLGKRQLMVYDPNHPYMMRPMEWDEYLNAIAGEVVISHG